MSALHDRCAYALLYIISNADSEDAASSEGHEKERSILICTHAASMIAIGRALTGHMPDDACVEDFKTYTYVNIPEQHTLNPYAISNSQTRLESIILTNSRLVAPLSS